jgi:hypothetical protein
MPHRQSLRRCADIAEQVQAAARRDTNIGVGSMQNLQVHHQQLRSRSGNNDEQNLITLCAPCHARLRS